MPAVRAGYNKRVRHARTYARTCTRAHTHITEVQNPDKVGGSGCCYEKRERGKTVRTAAGCL